MRIKDYKGKKQPDFLSFRHDHRTHKVWVSRKTAEGLVARHDVDIMQWLRA